MLRTVYTEMMWKTVGWFSDFCGSYHFCCGKGFGDLRRVRAQKKATSYSHSPWPGLYHWLGRGKINDSQAAFWVKNVTENALKNSSPGSDTLQNALRACFWRIMGWNRGIWGGYWGCVLITIWLSIFYNLHLLFYVPEKGWRGFR